MIALRHSFYNHMHELREKARKMAHKNALSLFFFSFMFVITWVVIVATNYLFGAP